MDETHLPGEQWTPSNGTEGDEFIEHWCRRCSRDKAMREATDIDECEDFERCDIIAAAYRGQAVEWRELPSGETICTAFVEHPQQAPEPRCAHTVDMFATENRK